MTNTTGRDSDEELLAKMAKGDEEAFVALYRRRQAAVFRFALQMSGSPAIAEDVTQEVFMALIKDSSGFSPEKGTLGGYLYGMARNHVLRRIERDRFMVPIETGQDDDNSMVLQQEDKTDDPLVALTRSETVESVRSAILALPAHYREVVVLCELHEMSYVETAEALNCAVGTVRSRLHRARGMLLEKLRAETHPKPVSSNANGARCFA
jgi:RNA polymerase sigma-70 factor (ECF subfamily)